MTKHPVRLTPSVVLVDDSDAIRSRLRALLEEGGVHVAGEADGVADAVATIARTRPDAVVLDLTLRDGSGFDVLRQVRQLHPGCAVIVVSNSTSLMHRDTARRLGADHFLDKADAFEKLLALLPEAPRVSPPFSASELLDSVDGIVWEADGVTFQFSFVSRQAERILGHPVGRWTSEPDFWQRHLHPDDRDATVEHCHVRTARGEDHSFEYRMRGADGRYVWLRDIVSVVTPPGGRPVLRGIMVDITVQKDMERRLQQSTRLHRFLSAVNQSVVRSPDPDTLFRRATEAAVAEGGFRMAWIATAGPVGELPRLRAIAGASQETTRLVERIVSTRGKAGCLQTQSALATGRADTSNDIAADPRAAHWRDTALALGYRSMVSVPFHRGGLVAGTFNLYGPDVGMFDAEELHVLTDLAAALSVALDACDADARQRETQRALEQSEERFRVLAETIDDVFWMSSVDKRQVMYVSPAYERTWGRPAEELYRDAKAWLEALHPDDRNRVHAGLSAQVAGGYDVEYRIVRPDGDVRWIRDQAFPVRLAGGTVERVVGIARDITARKLSEERLREAERNESIGRVAAAVAHDFNNVLSVVNGVAELALSATEPDSPMREDFAVIRTAGLQAANLTRQLLAYSRQQALAPEVVNVSALVADSEMLLRRAVGARVRLETALDPTLPDVFVDRGQLHQVLLNLAMNSRDAMPEGGVLSVATAAVEAAADPRLARGHYVRLAIADTGTGMDEATLRRVFEPYFTTKVPGKGTGLGLASVYGIVKQSGGEIFVTSAPGAGTTFSIYLPVHPAG